MASTWSALVKDYWVSMTEAARAHPDQTLEQVRHRVEDCWGSLPAEPGDETLLGESIRFDEAARAAGVDIRVDVFPGQQHTFHMAAGHVLESGDAIAGFAEWVRPRLGL